MPCQGKIVADSRPTSGLNNLPNHLVVDYLFVNVSLCSCHAVNLEFFVWQPMLLWKFISCHYITEQPPVAKAGPDITITLPDNVAILDGSESTDDYGIEEFQWTRTPKSPAAGVWKFVEDMHIFKSFAKLISMCWHNGAYLYADVHCWFFTYVEEPGCWSIWSKMQLQASWLPPDNW